MDSPPPRVPLPGQQRRGRGKGRDRAGPGRRGSVGRELGAGEPSPCRGRARRPARGSGLRLFAAALLREVGRQTNPRATGSEINEQRKKAAVSVTGWVTASPGRASRLLKASAALHPSPHAPLVSPLCRDPTGPCDTDEQAVIAKFPR